MPTHTAVAVAILLICLSVISVARHSAIFGSFILTGFLLGLAAGISAATLAAGLA